MYQQLEDWLDQHVESSLTWVKHGRKRGKILVLSIAAGMLLLFGGVGYLMTGNVKGVIGGAVFAAFLSLIAVPIILFSFLMSYSTKGMKESIQTVLEACLKTSDEQALFASEMLGEDKKIIPYISEKNNVRNSHMVLTGHFLVLVHDMFFSVVPLEKLESLYLQTDYGSSRVFLSSGASVTTATYCVNFRLKKEFEGEQYRPFFFREKKYARAAVAALREQLPAYTH